MPFCAASRQRRRHRTPLIVLACVFSLILVSCSGNEDPNASTNDRARDTSSDSIRPVSMRAGKEPQPPNVVVVLMDDFSMDLLPTMRSAERMRREGASYERSFVVDSLCCVSRTSLLTGQYPHQTGVRTNSAGDPDRRVPIGGWSAFEQRGNERRTFAGRLQREGYTTGFTGKFLNEYEIRDGQVPKLPPGWDDWKVLFGSAYDGWDFQSTWLDRSGKMQVKNNPAPPASAGNRRKDEAYAGTVIQRNAADFMKRNAIEDQPYFLTVTPYGPHSRTNPRGAFKGDPLFPPAFRDRPGTRTRDGDCGVLKCRDLTVKDLPGFGDSSSDNAPRRADGSRARSWRPKREPLSSRDATKALRNRARMVSSIDRMVTEILDRADDNTYVILTSDNGFHIGQHGLGMGKGTPYTSDVQVPLLITGPGVKPGPREEMVSNIDLAPTIEDLAGVRSPRYRSGTSLVPTLADPEVNRRDYAFFEHTRADVGGTDPDRAFTGGVLNRIPSYLAVRGPQGLLMRLDLNSRTRLNRAAWEFYPSDQIDRPGGFEESNEYANAEYQDDVRTLTRRLVAFENCQTAKGNAPVAATCRDLTR